MADKVFGTEPGTRASDPLPPQQMAQIARLQFFLAWMIPLAVVFVLLEGAIGLLFRDWVYSLASLTTLGCLISLLLARRQIRQHNIQGAVLIIAGTFIAATVIGVTVWSSLRSTLIVLPLLAVVVTLPYLSGRPLRNLMIAAWLAMLAAALLSELVPSSTSVPAWLSSTFRVSSLAATTTMVLLLLWQFSSRLTEMLSETRQSNLALQRAQADLEAQNELLDITLRSIGDGLITTDREGRIILINGVAEAFTGWSQSRAARQPFHHVLRLMDTGTGQPANQLAAEVVRQGAPLSLHNYTASAASEQRPRHISGMISPIYDPQGQLLGTVIVFRDVTEQRQAEQALLERARLAALEADVGSALIQSSALPDMLSQCAEAVVQHLDAALARVWTFNVEQQRLELQASAGVAVHTDGGHNCIPLGHGEIGLLAQERKPHLSNAVLQDERVRDREWAGREGLVAFAGYPLLIEDRLIGVIAMFARTQLTEMTLQAMAAVANEIALGIERKRTEELQQHLLEREQRARTEAEQALQIRDQFLSIAAHELKTPITAMLGYTQLLKRRLEPQPLLGERDHRSLQAVVEQTRRLHRLILALLDLSHIQTGQLAIDSQPLDLVPLAQRLVDEVRPTLERHTLDLQVSPQPLIVEGDELRLEQVLFNLLQNAIKYSPLGGPVEIALAVQDKHASIAVRDHGIGIPAASLPRLFTRFYRADNIVAHQISGMGLGLYVVKEIVSLHGGNIEVQSVEGQGSSFTIRLPLYEGQHA